MRQIVKFIQNTLLISMILFPGIISAKPYVIGNLIGQLGNQMFIIAASTSLALDNNATPVFPNFVNENNRQFNLAHNYEKIFFHLNAFEPKVKKKRKYNEPHFHYTPIPYKNNIVLNGYFQSEKYFIHHKQEIIDLFSPPPEILSYLKSKYSDIIDHPNTVSIHMRNYHKEDPEQKVYYTYGAEYFKMAMNLFPEDTLFIAFSNDLVLLKKELSGIPKNIRFIEGEDYIDDFYLMSLCKHNIICNSTFSWWAAYLNKNENKKVIAPFPWFNPKSGLNTKDLIPPEWVNVHLVD